MSAELIERLARATGLDRDLDIAIARACPVAGWRVEHDGTVSVFDGEGWYTAPTEVPLYTHSIDAALGLVPEGWDWRISGPDWYEGHRCMHFGYVRQYQEASSPLRDAEGVGRHIEPAIALCIAALKARQALSTPEAKP